MSANNLTKSIVRFLCFNDCVAWNVYNGGVYDPKLKVYRKNPTQKRGVFDVCGFRKSDGRHIEIEIKWGRDKMSTEQSNHFEQLKSSGSLCFVARNFDEFEQWWESLEKEKKSRKSPQNTNLGFGGDV